MLENKTGYGITTGNGVVTVDLSALVKELGTDLGLPAAALAKIPAGTGVITVMKSDQLSAAQDGVRLIKALSVWLIVLVIVLYGLAIYLAHGHRRSTLRNIGWAFVLVGLIVLVVHRVTGNYAVDALVQAGEPDGGPSRLADRELDPRRHRPGRRLLRARDRARRDPRRPAQLRHPLPAVDGAHAGHAVPA